MEFFLVDMCEKVLNILKSFSIIEHKSSYKNSV